jgi:hypothetical protein
MIFNRVPNRLGTYHAPLGCCAKCGDIKAECRAEPLARFKRRECRLKALAIEEDQT